MLGWTVNPSKFNFSFPRVLVLGDTWSWLGSSVVAPCDRDACSWLRVLEYGSPSKSLKPPSLFLTYQIVQAHLSGTKIPLQHPRSLNTDEYNHFGNALVDSSCSTRVYKYTLFLTKNILNLKESSNK